eukprot:5807782-Pyramimonas_sp.AAC.1
MRVWACGCGFIAVQQDQWRGGRGGRDAIWRIALATTDAPSLAQFLAQVAPNEKFGAEATCVAGTRGQPVLRGRAPCPVRGARRALLRRRRGQQCGLRRHWPGGQVELDFYAAADREVLPASRAEGRRRRRRPDRCKCYPFGVDQKATFSA